MDTLNLLFDWVLGAGLRSSLLVLAVLAVQWLLKNRLPSRWRYAMWLPVLVALLVPALPLLPAWMNWSSAQAQAVVSAKTTLPETMSLPQTSQMTQHGETVALEIGFATHIVLDLIGVDSAVEFHDQGGLDAEEVHDEGADRRLTAPLLVFEAACAQDLPQTRFGLGLVSPETAGPVSPELRGYGDDLGHGVRVQRWGGCKAAPPSPGLSLGAAAPGRGEF